MTREEIAKLEPTISVPEAAPFFGMSRSAMYELARRDEFPCKIIRLGRSVRVVTSDMLRTLGIEAS